ncbi:(d)CMP kinase, partial [Candidatus Aerophobetes bacterium]|nr:(d)CMP kinase [Candidatus Aerophobetes bacterium]
MHSDRQKSKSFIITIDGPAASGKSTAAYLLAKRLGFIYLDTGAMYRALTWKALQNLIDFENQELLSKMAENTKIDIFSREDTPEAIVFVDGKDVSHFLRTPQINKWVSILSRVGGVRSAMTKLQRKIAEEKSVVAEGRDMGTVVFPWADVKIFLTASLEERAKRRWKQLKEKGINSSIEEIKKELELRDKIDSEREIAPLKKAEDAF